MVADSSSSLIAFRGKLLELLLLKNEVYVFTPIITQPEIKEQLLDMGVIIHENSLISSNVSIKADLQYIKDLYKLIKAIRPDVIFPYAFKPVIYGCVVAKWCGVKRIVPMLSGLGYTFSKHWERKSTVRTLTKLLLKYSLRQRKNLHLIFQNADDRQTLLNDNVIGKKHQTYVVNGSGVDFDHYQYSEATGYPPVFLMIARLINAKGINEFVAAAKILKPLHQGTRFKLIGSFDDNVDAIDKELYEKLLAPGFDVEYYGHVSDVRPFIKSSSVIVLPSYYGEGLPTCLMESMAMGRALITTDSVGCKETVKTSPAHANGFLIPVKNVPSLVEAMNHFISYPIDINRFGLNSRKYSEEKFDMEVVNKQMLNILQD